MCTVRCSGHLGEGSAQEGGCLSKGCLPRGSVQGGVCQEAVFAWGCLSGGLPKGMCIIQGSVCSDRGVCLRGVCSGVSSQGCLLRVVFLGGVCPGGCREQGGHGHPGHKKDGCQRRPHRFYVSRPPPYPAAGSATDELHRFYERHFSIVTFIFICEE